MRALVWGAILTATLGLVSPICQAQTEKETLSRELFQATSPEGGLENIILDVLQESRPDESKELHEEILKALDLESIERQISGAYLEHLTEDEMRKAITFYRSPAGRKLVNVQVKIARETLHWFEDYSPRVFTQIDAILESERLQPGALADKKHQTTTVRTLRNVGTAMMEWLTDQAEEGAEGFLADVGPRPRWIIKPQGKTGGTTYRQVTHAELAAVLVPEYLPELPSTDGWGHPLEFAVNENLLGSHVLGIRAPGKDGKLGKAVYEVGPYPFEDLAQDTVWVDGYFARWPGESD